MATRNRKIEVYRLTISGLSEDLSYGKFLFDLWNSISSVADAIKKIGGKWHSLNEVHLRNQCLQLRFLSFKHGHRPDIFDTKRFALGPNPLGPDQTGVEWTHALGGKAGNRYLMLIERNHVGIWPTTIEGYLQWMIDKFFKTGSKQNDEDEEPITISMETEPGPEFIERINALDKIKGATVRIVRPNPGWKDLDSELSGLADDSDAHKAEITMKARRKASLDSKRGILEWIRSKFHDHSLDYASVSGKRGRQTESFNTKKLGKHVTLAMKVDDRGQVFAEDAWSKMTETLKKID